MTIERQKIDGSQREVFLEHGLDSCQGLAVDWMGRNLYWTDTGRGTISVARLDDASKRRVLMSVPHPRSIVVDPKRGMMYWSQWEFVVQVTFFFSLFCFPPRFDVTIPKRTVDSVGDGEK